MCEAVKVIFSFSFLYFLYTSIEKFFFSPLQAQLQDFSLIFLNLKIPPNSTASKVQKWNKSLNNELDI